MKAKLSIGQIAAALGARAVGDTDLTVSRLAEPSGAGADELAVAMSGNFLEQLEHSKAKAAILPADADWRAYKLKAAIFTERPRLAMAGLTAAFAAGNEAGAAAISSHALVDASAELAADVSVGAFSVIGAGARIGPGSVLANNVSIGPGVVIGAGARILPNVTILAGVTIGDNFFAHPGVVIGADGYSFVTAEPSSVEQVRANLGESTGAAAGQEWIKIHSLGGVRIGNDVEIGGNSNVDAGTIRPTEIGDGSKLDALVQVGHNVRVGRNCLLCAHVAVGGSAIIGDNCVLGGQSGVADNVVLGDGVVAGGATKILSNVPAGRAVLGYPATRMDAQVELYKQLRRLPRIAARISGLEKAVFKKSGKD